MIIDLIPWSDTTYEGVSLHAELDFPHGTNRGQVVKLTAGGTYVHDGGYYHEDREATITAHLRSKAQAEALGSLHVNRVVLYFSDEFGTYKAQIKDLNVVSRPAIISLIILECLVLFQDLAYPPAPVPAPIAEWLLRSSDTYWTNSDGNLTWFSSPSPGYWDKNPFQNSAELEVSGTWAVGFRPTKVRFESGPSNAGTGMTVDVYAGVDFIGYATINDSAGGTLDWPAVTSDITSIQFYNGAEDDPQTIENISFYGVEP